MTSERRRLRSDALESAIGMYLALLVKREHLRAVALAGDDGLLLAGAGSDDIDLDLLASLASIGASGDEHLRRLRAEVGNGARVQTAHLSLNGRRFYLGFVGTGVPHVDGIATDLRRILAALVDDEQPSIGPLS